jgi:hypothetical protein
MSTGDEADHARVRVKLVFYEDQQRLRLVLRVTERRRPITHDDLHRVVQTVGATNLAVDIPKFKWALTRKDDNGYALLGDTVLRYVAATSLAASHRSDQPASSRALHEGMRAYVSNEALSRRAVALNLDVIAGLVDSDVVHVSSRRLADLLQGFVGALWASNANRSHTAVLDWVQRCLFWPTAPFVTADSDPPVVWWALIFLLGVVVGFIGMPLRALAQV